MKNQRKSKKGFQIGIVILILFTLNAKINSNIEGGRKESVLIENEIILITN